MPKGFQPGHKQATGRPKGAENQEKKQLRQAITAIIEGGVGDFQQTMNELRETNPKAYIDNYIKLIEYSMPKLRSVDTTLDLKDKVESINIEIKKPKDI